MLNPRSIRFRMTAWYVGVLTICLALFGAGIYAGLARYLISAARASLRQEAQAIGESLLFDYDQRGPSYIRKEMSEDYAPEIKDRFIRVTLSSGVVLYQSGAPRDGSFDPAGVPRLIPFQIGSRTEQTSSGRILIESVWYRSPAGNRFFIENGMPESSIDRILRGLLWSLGLAFPVVVAGAAFGGYWIMRRSLGQVNEITRQAEQITSRNLGQRIPTVRSGDEIERLSTALNHMIARLEGAFHHINRFSADASHELRTPLTIIRGELESLVRERHSHEETLETLGSSLEEVDRLTRIVDDLLAISRLDAGETSLEQLPVDLSGLASATVEQMKILAEEKTISLHFQSDGPVEVFGDRWRLRQVIVNLVANAIKYTRPDGTINVAVASQSGKAILEVIDNGIGIAPEDLPHVFERFYIGNRSRSRELGGTGLGLPIVKAICTAHQAEIFVSSQPSVGTAIRVEFSKDSPVRQLHATDTTAETSASAREAGIVLQ